jgi:hypothetical protein
MRGAFSFAKLSQSLGIPRPKDQIDRNGVNRPPLTGKVTIMPLTHFLSLIAFVIFAAGATISLFVWADLPLVALGFAALAGSLVLGARQWR